MKKWSLVFLLMSLGIMTALAQNLQTDKAVTAITFKVKNLGLNVDGVFSEFKIVANFEEDKLSESYFAGTAVVKSIDTGINQRDKHLQKADYFDSERFPELTLTSDKLTKIGEREYEFKGQLSIKGKIKPLTFPITVERTAKGILVKGKFDINRLDFGVGASSWILKKKVRVSIVYQGNFVEHG